LYAISTLGQINNIFFPSFFAMLSKIIDFAYLLEPTIFNSLFFEILIINSEVICELEI